LRVLFLRGGKTCSWLSFLRTLLYDAPHAPDNLPCNCCSSHFHEYVYTENVFPGPDYGSVYGHVVSSHQGHLPSPFTKITLTERRTDSTLKPWRHTKCCPKNIAPY
jgi:hypothetical protein